MKTIFLLLFTSIWPVFNIFAACDANKLDVKIKVLDAKYLVCDDFIADLDGNMDDKFNKSLRECSTFAKEYRVAVQKLKRCYQQKIERVIDGKYRKNIEVMEYRLNSFQAGTYYHIDGELNPKNALDVK